MQKNDVMKKLLKYKIICYKDIQLLKYATGDPEKLCLFTGNTASKFYKYQDTIIELLRRNLQMKDILHRIQEIGCTGKYNDTRNLYRQKGKNKHPPGQKQGKLLLV
jgi:hypothetical protein